VGLLSAAVSAWLFEDSNPASALFTCVLALTCAYIGAFLEVK
jgi:hypothetical protein